MSAESPWQEGRSALAPGVPGGHRVYVMLRPPDVSEVSVSPAAYWLSGALATVAAAASAAMLAVPGILGGTAAMNGSARGTALVVLVLAVPTLLLSMLWASRGSARAVLLWLGAVAYLLYNGVMFLFATPFNHLFFLYVAMLSLALWSAASLLARLDARVFPNPASSRLGARALALYAWIVVALNALAWLRQIVPGLLSRSTPAFLAGTGLLTSPVYVQDLAVWLPLMAVGAVWLWMRRPWGYVVVGALLTLWVLESASVAIDQWFGHAANPASPAASLAVVPLFGALALVGLVPLYLHLRHLVAVII